MKTINTGNKPTPFTVMQTKFSENFVLGTTIIIFIGLLLAFSSFVTFLAIDSSHVIQMTIGIVGLSMIIVSGIFLWLVGVWEANARESLEVPLRKAAYDAAQGKTAVKLPDYISHLTLSSDIDGDEYMDSLSPRQMKWLEKRYYKILEQEWELQRRRLKNKPALNTLTEKSNKHSHIVEIQKEIQQDNETMPLDSVENEREEFTYDDKN